MIYNTAIIKNIDSVDHSILGTVIAPGGEYTVPDQNRVAVANNDSIISKISSGKLQVGDSVTYFSGINKQIDWLKNVRPISEVAPFNSKILPDGQKLYSRVHGEEKSLTTGSNTLTFSVPYPTVKMTGIELIGAEFGDKVDFKILDDSSGTYSTIPNHTLNQFGYNVYLSKDYYIRESSYDADLYYGMVVEITYNSVSTKSVYINYLLHEVKS